LKKLLGTFSSAFRNQYLLKNLLLNPPKAPGNCFVEERFKKYSKMAAQSNMADFQLFIFKKAPKINEFLQSKNKKFEKNCRKTQMAS
jgi:hypothetical protein